MMYEGGLPQRQLVRVPDVVGLPLRKALLLVNKAGLQVGAVLYKESYEEKDMVLEQKPQRGQMVYGSDEVTLWVSRESYIKWLPAIYQRSDTTGRNVVRDLLWLVQHLFGSIDSILDTIHTYFNSYETPTHFLTWLASWSAMVLEPDWPENKKRRLIKKAMELYRLRGTVRGLKLFVSLFTGMEPELVENEWPFKGFSIGVSSTVGIDTVILPPVDKSHSFVVVMPHEFKDTSPEEIIRLHEIIDKERPSHTTYMLKFAEPKIPVEEREFYRIGVTSGVNIGQEVVTPLPMNEETGEPELPKEPEMPPPQPDPSVYELFAPRRRQLPPIVNAPRADSAPVEGREITSNKYGFEDAARVFRLDDIMRELLQREGGGAAAAGETGGPGGPGGDGDSLIPRVQATAEVEGYLRGGKGPDIQVDIEEIDAQPVEEEGEESATPAVALKAEPVPAAAQSPTARTIVPDLEPATPARAKAKVAEEGEAPDVQTLAQVEGGLRGGRQPKIEVDLDVQEVERDADEAEEPKATATATATTSSGAAPALATIVSDKAPTFHEPGHETQPAARPETKTEAKPEAKPETKTETKPEPAADHDAMLDASAWVIPEPTSDKTPVTAPTTSPDQDSDGNKTPDPKNSK
ncbi:MAG: phage tail protein [Polyangia bacterium]